MPRRETQQLVSAIRDYLDAYADDPKYRELSAKLKELLPELESSLGRADGEPSPGQRAAQQVHEETARRRQEGPPVVKVEVSDGETSQSEGDEQRGDMFSRARRKAFERLRAARASKEGQR